MLTLVISLPDAVDRQHRIAGYLEAAEIHYSLIPAVVGRNLTADQIAVYAPSRYMVRFCRELGLGEIGCTLSHEIALQTFLASTENIALILEDDAVVPKHLMKALQHLLDCLPDGWGVLKLGGIGGVRGWLPRSTA